MVFKATGSTVRWKVGQKLLGGKTFPKLGSGEDDLECVG